MNDRLDASADTLADMMKAADKGIPQDLLDKAKCVVVVPGMKKAGFILGAKYGQGFAACRHNGGTGWSAPAAMRVEGGSVGFQIGASETDVILLVMNDGGMKHLLSDKFTIGGDATAAAGPLGRATSAQTDAMLNAEMLVVFPFARTLCRHLAGRRNAPSGRGHQQRTIWPPGNES